MKCLIVDDSAITRRILINHLRAIGITQVLEAGDGARALEVCAPDVDFVITDWNMPGMSGAEFVRGLRAAPNRASLPVLLVASRNAKDDVAEALNAGVNGYVIKPFTAGALQEHIAALLVRQDRTGTDA